MYTVAIPSELEWIINTETAQGRTNSTERYLRLEVAKIVTLWH